VESCRLAFADALAQVADPVVHRELPVEALLSQDRAAQRYKQFFDPGQVCAHRCTVVLWAVCVNKVMMYPCCTCGTYLY
jgi:hypothetical protein